MHMSGPPELNWPNFLGSWHFEPWWLAVLAVLSVAYLYGWRRAGRGSTVAWWRVAAFLAGTALTWVCVASGIGGYAMSVFWMHMVLHLMLIMVVPALLVLGHPITVLVEALPPRAADRARRVLRSRPLAVITSPVGGLVVYSVVIVYTHLGGFMDRMAVHSWLMPTEEVAYVLAGYLLLLPVVGEEPIARNAPYLVRLVVLMAAMIPDTVVGIVLLQTDSNPYPAMMAMHPHWAPDPLDDIHVAGGLMWAGGLMMLIAVGLMVAVITSPQRRERMTGAWLEGVRRSTLIEHAQRSGVATDDATGPTDADSEEARAAYNEMLARLNQHE